MRRATGVTGLVHSACSYNTLVYDKKEFDLATVYKSLGFDFSKIWMEKNVGIKPKEIMQSKHTAPGIKALEFHNQKAKFNPTIQ